MMIQDLLQNRPNLPWIVQKFGGTSIGKHASKVRLFLVLFLPPSPPKQAMNPLEKTLLTILVTCRLPRTLSGKSARLLAGCVSWRTVS